MTPPDEEHSQTAGPEDRSPIDANEAWTASRRPPTASVNWSPSAISSVEQPIPHRDVAPLARVRQRSTPSCWMNRSARWSMRSERVRSVRLLQPPAVEVRRVQFRRCGWLSSRRGTDSGISWLSDRRDGDSVGSQSHFATSVNHIRSLEGSYDRHLVQFMLGEEDITFGWGGWAPALVRTGLGIGVQEDFVERLALRKEVFIG